MENKLTKEEFEKKFKEVFDELWQEKGKVYGFTKPQGQIGDSGAYRISDNCITGKGGWELYLKILKETANKYNIDVEQK